MKLIFLYGLPASGKLTIAQELSTITGYKVFHNHLAVDMLLAVFDFGSPPFVELREEIWLAVFSQACQAGLPGLIFTFAPERTVRPSFIAKAVDTVRAGGGEIFFVEIASSLDEIRARLSAESRSRHGKLTSVGLFDELREQGVFDAPQMPAARVSIDSGLFTPVDSASRIAHELGLRG